MPRTIIKHKYNKFTVFHRSIMNRETSWPHKPRLDIPYSEIV